MHIPIAWKQALGGVLQATGVPMQVPPMQIWFAKQPSWRLHIGVPCGGGFEHWPLAGLQMPASWHWSEASQTTGVALTQLPAMHLPFGAQAPWPVSHIWPSELGWPQTLDGMSMKV